MAHPAMQDLPPAPDARARECKQKLDGSTQRFELEPWLVTPRCFVGRWTAEPDNPFGARAGITSWGVWWRTRPYGVYRIHDVDGALLLYRLDVVKDVRISADGVRYRDLILDAHFRPQDRRRPKDRSRPRDDAGLSDGSARKLDVRLEDEDELEQLVREGLLSAADQRRVRWTRELFLRRPERIAHRVDAAIEEAIVTVRAAQAPQAAQG